MKMTAICAEHKIVNWPEYKQKPRSANADSTKPA
jgi:hypothetical protein